MKTLLLTLLMLTGCGTYEVPKTEVKQVDPEASPTPAPDESKPVTKKSHDGTTVEVETTTKVTVNTGESSPKAPDWRFVERRKTFANAAKDAPAGYRLPTRLELLTAFEGGEFEGYTGQVWTSEHAADRDDHVYFFKLSDGQSFAYPVESLFETLYVSTDDESTDRDAP